MARTERQTGRQAEYACPACKQPVDTVIERHKTLGIFVPQWGPGPCHNADCRRHTAASGPGDVSGVARGSHTVGR